MRETKIIVKTNSKKYPIIIGSNILKKISNILKSNNIFFEKCIIIADKNVPKKNIFFFKKNLKCKIKLVHFFNSSEKNKNQKNVDKILNILLKNNFSRSA